MSLLDDLADRWTPEPNTGCYLWHGIKHATWRPKIWVDGKTRFVARLVCEETNGPPPTPEHLAAHNTPNGCVGEACVNGGHLRWATKRENGLDFPEKQRSEIGRKWLLLSPERRIEIARNAARVRWARS
jgi:hypothetical protein